MSAVLLVSLGITGAGFAAVRRFARMPRVFSGSGARVRDALLRCPSLHRPYRPTFWCPTAQLQFLLFLWKCDADAKKVAWVDEEFMLPDSQLVRLCWVPHPSPKGVVVLLHGILGNSHDFALLAKSLVERGYTAVGFDRRGHKMPLTVPRFNTTGSVDDLACVLQHIRSKVSGVPVYGVGLSAGSSLLARYLGDTGSSSLIAAGVCISPGFSFRKSLSTMSRSTGALVLSRMKAFFLTPNASVLQDLPGYTEMQASKTQMEWHVHQYNFSPHGNMESYFLNEDPDHVLHNIQVPIIYLNAKDDIAFPGPELTFAYAELARTNEHAVVVQTDFGGHGCFYEGVNADSWCYDVALEWIEGVHATTKGTGQ